MINLKTTIINVLRRFELLPGNIDAEIKMYVTLKTNGFYVALKKK